MKSSSISIVLIFIIGLSAGIGISYFYFSGFETGAVSERIKKQKEVKKQQKDQTEKTIGPIKKTNKLKEKPTEIELLNDSLLNKVEEDSDPKLNLNTSENLVSKADSIAKQKVAKKQDTAHAIKSNLTDNGEDIIIETEELIESFKVTIKEAVALDENRKKSDSLAANLAGVTPTNKQVFTVEYWISPLNFKGYKMANNKIVIYGFEHKESFKLFRLESNIYAAYEGSYYNLKNTYEYLPLKKVVDETTILRLKQF